MNKAQRIVAGFFIIAIIVIAGLYAISLKPKTILPSEDVLYYSLTCPHCKIVEQFIKDNNIALKVNFTQKEVSLNAQNGKELVGVGTYCKIPAEYIGAIPLFYSDKKCYLGVDNIENILKIKAGLGASIQIA